MFELPPPENDGLYIPDVGPWSRDKHHYLMRYIDIFTTGMKNQAWELHYIDLFSNAGIENVEGHGLSWGSPLLAAQAANRFKHLHVCELKKKPFNVLSKRIARFPQPTPPQLLKGDANQMVYEVARAIPIKRTLSLAFLDPCGLHLDFDTLRVLCHKERRIDLIIFFPDRLDALRNFGIYLNDPESNLDGVMGGAPWRDILRGHPNDKWAEELRKMYEKQIGMLGYHHFDYIRINKTDGAPLYVLIFCSKHPRGGEFWTKIRGKDIDGQRSLF